MDTRRGTDAHEDRPKPELGTETVPVELIELQSVGSSGRKANPKAVLGIAVVGVLVFSAVVLSRQPQVPTPSPSAPITGLASPSAASSTSAPTVPPATFRPSITPPTPIPTAPPPWQWTPSDFLPDLHASLEGIWAIDNTILALMRGSDSGGRDLWSMARLGGEGEWEVFPVPAAIDRLSGGAVFEGRLWAMAHVGGIAAADATMQLVSTDDGETWVSEGASGGLSPLDAVTILARAGESWVIVTEQDRPMGQSHAEISWSADGVSWLPATVPALRSNVEYRGAAALGGTTVLLGFEFDDPEFAASFTLRSTDGQTWKRSIIEPPSGGFPQELACNDRRCIITIEPPSDLGRSTGQGLMITSDGVDWSEVAANVPWRGPNSTITKPATTATGFIALTGDPPQALLSADGIAWRVVDVLPPDPTTYITELLVVGDTVVAVSPAKSSDEVDRLWFGSLAAMGN